MNRNKIPHNPFSLFIEVCGLNYNGKESVLGKATGFIIKKTDKYFLITNWHVVTGRNFFNPVEFLDQKECLPTKLKIWVPIQNVPGTNSSYPIKQCISVDLDLYKDLERCKNYLWLDDGINSNGVVNNKGKFIPKRKEFNNSKGYSIKIPRSDVIILPLESDFCNSEECLIKNNSDFILDINNNVQSLSGRNHNIYGGPLPIGSEVYIVGFPYGYNISWLDYFKEPVWKKGYVISRYGFGDYWESKLLDLPSKKGMSGSPVLYLDQKTDALKVVGIYSSRLHPYKLDRDTHMGVIWLSGTFYKIINNFKTPIPSAH